MSKDKISDYSATANSNTDIGGINIDEGCAPSGINDAIRTLMKQLKDWQSGSQDVYIHPAGSASVPSITATGDTNTGIFFPAADTVGITTGGTERARVDSSGNLGLGVTPSAWNTFSSVLQVPGGAIAGIDASQVGLWQNAYYNSGYKYKSTAAATFYQQSGASHIWYNAPSGTAGNAITFTQAMTLDASGNLGVGTTSPAGKLDVAGTIAISSGNAQSLIRRTTVNGSYGVQIQGNTNDTRSDTYPGASITVGGGPVTGDAYAGRVELVAYGNLTDSTSNIINFQRRTGVNTVAESARIDSSGALLVGTTSKVGNPQIMTVASNTVAGMHINGSSASVNYGFTFYYNSGQTGQVSWNTTTTTYATSSDYRLKENIAPMTGALAKVAALKPCTYTWKSDGSDGEGFIAHELAEVCPQAVVGEKDAVNEDGSIKAQGIDTSFLVATLTAAIQEQQALITQLQADVAALKGQA